MLSFLCNAHQKKRKERLVYFTAAESGLMSLCAQCSCLVRRELGRRKIIKFPAKNEVHFKKKNVGYQNTPGDLTQG